MSDVKRFGIGTQFDAHEFGEKQDGEYVQYSDYMKLRKKSDYQQTRLKAFEEISSVIIKVFGYGEPKTSQQEPNS